MDSGTTPLQSPGFLATLTSVHFVLIAVLAVLTIIGIAYGMKLSRRRRQGVRELEDAGHLERSGEAPAETVAVEREAAPVAASAPVVAPEPVESPVAAPVAIPEPMVPPVATPVATPAPAPAAADDRRGAGPAGQGRALRRARDQPT